MSKKFECLDVAIADAGAVRQPWEHPITVEFDLSAAQNNSANLATDVVDSTS